MIIAIDGPAGSGKSTVASHIARELGFLKLDTGAMYRAVALLALECGLDLDDTEALTELARSMTIAFEQGAGDVVRILVDGRDVSEEIRTPRVDAVVSRAASVAGVRSAMLGQQRAAARDHSIVAEGRDIGTVVFPEADLKVFLTADPLERARRRVMQRHAGDGLDETDLADEIERTRASIEERDRHDSENLAELFGTSLDASPDAVLIDSSSMSLDQVVERVKDLVSRREEVRV